MLFFHGDLKELLAALLQEDLEGAGAALLVPPTYMMTWLSPSSTRRPPSLLAKLGRAADILVSIMGRFGFRVNFEVGKTEGLVHLAGAGWAEARALLWHGQVGGVPTIPLAMCQRLRMVTKYKHLGIMATSCKALDPEFAARLGGGRTVAACVRLPARPR